MDGGLFSFETDYEKPDPEFFKIFLEKYNLDPASCAFFDDRVDNVEVARSLGFNAYLFDNQSTYLDLMGHEDMKDDNKTMLIVDNTAGFDILNVNDVQQWYIGTRNPNDIEPDSACKFGKLSDCVDSYIKSESLPDNDTGDAPTEYVTLQAWALMNPELRNDDVTDTRRKWISVGVIEIDIHNGNYKWVYQTPLKRIDGIVYDVSGLNTGLSEWAMASCNPIQGIRKPFILKVGCDTGGIINTKQYAFSPDIINDKYLAISEEGVLEFVDSSEYDDCTVEEYEYVGDSSKLSKIYEAYSTGQIVDNTFFYTALTGKPMLTEDQIDFDSNFRKVDFELMRQKKLSTQATFESARNISLGGATYTYPINEDAISRDIPYLKKYSIIDELYVQRDNDGYYFFNSLNNKRSSSVDSISMLTEAMIKSIL
jgi:putative hydrolase of the HAD superfamily